MLDRRYLIVSAASLVACAPHDEPNLTAIWLRISPDGAGYILRVESDIVAPANLEAALLDHAIAANPDLTRDAVREQVRIYVRVDPGTPSTWVPDLMPVLNRFGKVGIVGEDRRA